MDVDEENEALIKVGKTKKYYIRPKKPIPKEVNIFKEKIQEIFHRVPDQLIKLRPEVGKVIRPEKKIHFDILTNSKKPQLIKINKSMKEDKVKLISNINSFKEMYYELHKEDDNEESQEVENIKKDNEIFSKIYTKLQRDKNKFSSGTYLDYESLIGIASHYYDKGMLIPSFSVHKNIFSGNPLILEGSELENYFLFEFGDGKKSIKFLERIEDDVLQKNVGISRKTMEQKERLKRILKNEKPKHYVPPETLIPKLQNDINETEESIENLNDLNSFVKHIDYDEKKEKAEKLFRRIKHFCRLMTKNRKLSDYPRNDSSLVSSLNTMAPSRMGSASSIFQSKNISTISNRSSAFTRCQKPSAKVLNDSRNTPRLVTNQSNSDADKKNVITFDQNKLKKPLVNYERIPSSFFMNRMEIIKKNIIENNDKKPRSLIRNYNSFIKQQKYNIRNCLNGHPKKEGVKSKSSDKIELKEKDYSYLKDIDITNLPNLFNKVENNYDNIYSKKAIENYCKMRNFYSEDKKKLKRQVNRVMYRYLLNVNDKNLIDSNIKIKRKGNIKFPLLDREMDLLEKDNQYVDLINKNDYNYKKIICEGSFDKSKIDILK